MQNELPEWAVTVARETVVGTMAQASPLFIERVARALVVAERRGIGRAADIAEGFEGGAGTNPWGWPDRIAAAIRQIGEEP